MIGANPDSLLIIGVLRYKGLFDPFPRYLLCLSGIQGLPLEHFYSRSIDIRLFRNMAEWEEVWSCLL